MKTKMLLSTSLFLMLFSIQAQIINVPGDYPTIQEGINAAVDGDTVLVQPETYTENINFLGKDITVGSLYLTTEDTIYFDQTIIDGDQNGTSVVTFENEESEDAKLIGFTITNGYSSTSGGGIMCVLSSPSLHYLYIQANEAAFNGGGIICGAFANPNLNNVKVMNNTSGSDGGGIYCYNNCSPSIENVILSDNSTDHHGGGICCLENSSPTLNQVLISNNMADQGGGIFSAFNSNLDLQDVALIGNEATAGGGVFMSENSLTFVNVMVANNNATTGGGIFADNFSELYMDSTDVSGNIATNKGAGIYSFNTRSYHINNCSIMENEIIGGLGGGICFDMGVGLEEPPEIIIENTIISNNTGSESGYIAGAYFYKSDNAFESDVKINNCTFENNVSRNSSGLSIRGIGLGFEIINCNFLYNEAEQFTAAVALRNGCDGKIVNCLFDSNMANMSGEEWNSGALSIWNQVEVDLLNCTFVNNSAYYGSAFAMFASDLLMLNTIVWDNEYNQITLLDAEEIGSTMVVAYSDIQGGEESIDLGELSVLDWAGENIDEDPIFMESGEYPYSLDLGSPCIDAGTPDTTGMELPATDLMGNIRVWDGDGDQVAIIDMGPYEYGSVGVGVYEGPSETVQQCMVYPNPFKISATISYELTQTSSVQLSIYNQLGQLIYQRSEQQQQGAQQLQWDGMGQAEGLYYYRLKIGDQLTNGKMVKAK